MTDVARNQAMKGLTFAITTGAVSVANNANLLILLTNPSGSVRDSALEFSVASAGANSTFEIRLNPTKTGTFTSATPAGSSVTSVITAETANGTDVNLTGGSLIHAEAVPDGACATLSSDGRIVIQPNNTIGFKISPTGAGICSITAVWTEAPV